MPRTMDLPCALTDMDVELKQDQLVTAMTAIEDEERAFERAKQEHKGRVATLKAEVKQLHAQLRDRREVRPVEVRDQADYQNRKVETVRVDTGEVVGLRPMTQADRQLDVERPLQPPPKMRG